MLERYKVSTGHNLPKVPENNLLNRFDQYYFSRSQITKGHSQEWQRAHPTARIRPLLARSKRAELLKKFWQTEADDKNARRAIYQEARQRDRILNEYLNQTDLAVNLPTLGEQKVKFARLTPPENLKINKAPIVLLGGISNDLDPMASLAWEAAFQGREIIMIGYPESTQGSITKEFADAVERGNPFSIHADFFKKAIETILPPDENGNYPEFELWGYSTGGPIGAEMLNDPDFIKRVKDAIFICPASAITQSPRRFKLGLAREAGKAILTRFNSLALYSFVQPRKSEKDPDKDRVYNKLMHDILYTQKAYRTARVREGGKILVVSGDHDFVTKSAQGENAFRENPNIDFLNIPGGTHLTPLIDAEHTIRHIFAAK